METVEATLLGAIIIIGSCLVIGVALTFIGYLLARLLIFIPNTISDKINVVLDKLTYVFIGIIFIIVLGGICYQVGVDFLG